MSEYVLQWIVQPKVCERATELESTPLFLNFGNGRTQWIIKLVNNNNVIQFSLISDNRLPILPFNTVSIKCVNKTRTLAELLNASYKTGVFEKDCIVRYHLKVIRTTLADLTNNYREPFRVIVSFDLTHASRLRITTTQWTPAHKALTSPPQTSAKPHTIKPPAPVVQKPLTTTKLYVFAAEKNHAEQILQDYAHLLNDHRHSDLKVIVKDHHFQCHKSILAVRCEAFADLIRYNGNADTMTLLQAIDVETAADLLYYIYAGRAPNIVKSAERLMVAADLFKLNLLKSRCEETLRLKVEVNNALPLLRLTDRVDTVYLKKVTLDFVRKNLRSLLTNCSAFKDEMAKDPAFFYDLMSQIA